MLLLLTTKYLKDFNYKFGGYFIHALFPLELPCVKINKICSQTSNTGAMDANVGWSVVRSKITLELPDYYEVTFIHLWTLNNEC